LDASHQSVARAELHRNLVFRLFVLMKTAAIHEHANVLFQESLAAFKSVLGALLEKENGLILEEKAGFLFANGVRVRLDVEGFAALKHMVQVFMQRNISGLVFDLGLADAEVLSFLDVFSHPAPDQDIVEELSIRGVERIHVIARRDDDRESEAFNDQQPATGVPETYFKSIFVAKHLLEGVRQGGSVDMRAAKRVVQTIVDLILDDESTLLTLTGLREFDTSIFSHSVNVSVLSMILGQRIGIPRNLVGDLGTAALFHDIGMLDMPKDSSPHHEAGADAALAERHPSLGLRRLITQDHSSDLMRRAAITAYEHHLGVDSEGYPPGPIGEVSLLSRIVQLADAYEEMTNPLDASSHSLTQAQALEAIRKDAGKRFDSKLVDVLEDLVLSSLRVAGPEPAR
jgi:hypothetical protein